MKNRGRIYLKLYFKKTSKEARYAMSEAVMDLDHAINRGYEYIQNAQEIINHYTNHDHVRIVNSGNSAILTAMSFFKGRIMLPDQGGWSGFKNAADFLGLETVELNTNLGIINLNSLSESIEKYQPESLFITSFAGYIAEQPLKEIYEICNDNNVTVVLDASGGIGDKKDKLSNGNYAHIIVASTGSPKIVNVGSGGFISTNDNEVFKKNKFILKTLKANPIICAGIAEEIKNAPHFLFNSIQACKSIKKCFKSAVHKDKRGISVALKTKDPKKIGLLLRQNLKTEKRNIITICPRYDRLLIEAICLEIKNLDFRCLQKNTINDIIQIIKEVTEIN